MKILVINAGSSSLKYQLYDMTDESVLAAGRVERIGMDSSILVHEPHHTEEITEVSEILDHTTAIRKVLDKLTDAEVGVLKSTDEIDAVGHRVVHGGESFKIRYWSIRRSKPRFVACSIWRRCIIRPI